MQATETHSFEIADQLTAWLNTNHASRTELWARVFKKGSGIPTVDWNDCVAALTWG